MIPHSSANLEVISEEGEHHWIWVRPDSEGKLYATLADRDHATGGITYKLLVADGELKLERR